MTEVAAQIAFLKARLDEDEAAARACQSPSPWKAADHEADSWIVTEYVNGRPVIYNEGTPSLEEAAHIARHDPARVLRDVAAKRKIAASLEEDLRIGARTDLTDGGQIALIYACKCLAAAWSDHPDYARLFGPAAVPQA